MGRLTIFLADLVHNQRIYNYCAPLNVGCIAAAVEAAVGKAVDMRVFKFPDLLIEALADGPDILALSNYDWNVNLNRAVIAMARAGNPDVFVVVGGPNLRRGEAGVRDYLLQHPEVDAYVLNEGEEAFVNLVVHVLGASGHPRRALIGGRKVLPQIAYLDADGVLVVGPACPTAGMNPIPHPSAWLSGWMAPFLDVSSFPLSPIVETTRGCPYMCTYCTAWGTAATGAKSIRQYPLETVFEELRYIFSRSRNPFFLFLGDANMGILERDLEIVAEVRRLADVHGNVVGIGLDSSKNMVKRNIEIFRILGDLCVPSFAQQTFNVDVSEHIGRRNVPVETVRELVEAAHADGSQVSTDLLVGLPTEDRARHVESVKVAYDCGFDKIQISDIRLLKGTEMEETHQRERYGLREKVRIIPNAFGRYAGERVIDYEHCIRETAVMREEDFLELRLFHAHMFVVLNLEIGRPLIDFSTRHGFHAIDLLNEVSRLPPEGGHPRLRSYFHTYMERARSEWFADEEEANAHYLRDEAFERLMTAGFPKLNYDYAARLALDGELKDEFFAWMSGAIKRQLPHLDPALVDEVADFASARIMPFPFDGATQTLRLSRGALAEVRGYVTSKREAAGADIPVDLIPDPQALDLFRKNLDHFGAGSNISLAVQLVLQYSNKALIRDAVVAEDLAA